jgi:hypothetical protein
MFDAIDRTFASSAPEMPAWLARDLGLDPTTVMYDRRRAWQGVRRLFGALHPSGSAPSSVVTEPLDTDRSAAAVTPVPLDRREDRDRSAAA